MDMRSKALDFCYQNNYRKFYQPIIFIPGVIEIPGKWNNATRRLSEDLFSDIYGKTILDLGCHIGYFLREALKKGAQKAVGVELDTAELSIANEISSILEDKTEFVEDNLETYTPNCSFDYILMLNILDVLTEPKSVIEKYLRFTSERLTIEHEPDHQRYFPYTPTISYPSPRSHGYRIVSHFEVQ